MGLGRVISDLHWADVAMAAREDARAKCDSALATAGAACEESRACVVSARSADISALRTEDSALRRDVVELRTIDSALRRDVVELRTGARWQSAHVSGLDLIVRDLQVRCEALESEVGEAHGLRTRCEALETVVARLANRSDGDGEDGDHRYHQRGVASADGLPTPASTATSDPARPVSTGAPDEDSAGVACPADPPDSAASEG